MVRILRFVLTVGPLSSIPTSATRTGLPVLSFSRHVAARSDIPRWPRPTHVCVGVGEESPHFEWSPLFS
jgi:hypothetical protein